ncbi:helix-turn-helix domain-containing protein [Shigella flexneri]
MGPFFSGGRGVWRTSCRDWRPADVLAALEKRHINGSRITQRRLSPSTLANVLSRPWPRGR